MGLDRPQLTILSRHLVVALILGLLFLSACAPANQKEEELRKEIKALKAKITAMQAQLDQLQGEQRVIIALMKQSAPEPGPKPTPPSEQLLPNLAPAAQPLTVGQLLAGKDRYLGTLVTVKGRVGPVMVHHKSFMLKSSQGMVEVLFGNLPDPKTIQLLTNTPMEDKAITVTGVVNLPPSRGAGAQLQIKAEAVQF